MRVKNHQYFPTTALVMAHYKMILPRPSRHRDHGLGQRGNAPDPLEADLAEPGFFEAPDHLGVGERPFVAVVVGGHREVMVFPDGNWTKFNASLLFFNLKLKT